MPLTGSSGNKSSLDCFHNCAAAPVVTDRGVHHGDPTDNGVDNPKKNSSPKMIAKVHQARIGRKFLSVAVCYDIPYIPVYTENANKWNALYLGKVNGLFIPPLGIHCSTWHSLLYLRGIHVELQAVPFTVHTVPCCGKATCTVADIAFPVSNREYAVADTRHSLSHNSEFTVAQQ